MLLILTWTGGVFLGMALIGACYALSCTIIAGPFLRRQAHYSNGLPSVTILKPLHGDEPGLETSLETFCGQHYSAPIQIVFGVHDGTDPALAVAARVIARHPELDATIVADSRIYGSNRKISNLMNMVPESKHDVLVLSDSDIVVPPHWLHEVMQALGQKGVGVVTCLYAGKPHHAAGGSRLWPILAAMGTSYDFLPNVIFGMASGLAAPCFGSTIALKRSVLEEIGGLSRFKDLLADDYELGRAVREQGYRLALPSLKVDHLSADSGAKELFRHEMRWARTTRLVNPIGYLGSVITFSLPLALIGLVLSGLNPFGWLTVGAALMARLALKWRLDQVFKISSGPAFLLPLRDVLSFAVFVMSLLGESVHWRGERFEVAPSGAMSQS